MHRTGGNAAASLLARRGSDRNVCGARHSEMEQRSGEIKLAWRKRGKGSARHSEMEQRSDGIELAWRKCGKGSARHSEIKAAKRRN